MVLLLCTTGGVFAQSTQPAGPPPSTQPVATSAFEKKTLQRPAGAVRTDPAVANKPTVPTSPAMGTLRVVMALALVIVVIFLLRWIAQQYFGAPSAKKTSQAVQVLSRSMISPKQQIVLLQVGRRVLIVGDAGGQMNSLAEITDQDEIAALVTQLRHDKQDPVTRAFSGIFRRAQTDFDTEDREQPARPPAAADPELDPALATTQAELSGLMDKVRDVARNMGRQRDG